MQAKGEDCITNPITAICAAARTINTDTRRYRDQVDMMWDAYNLVGQQLNECKIIYNNVELSCESQSDKILAALITLRKLLPEVE